MQASIHISTRILHRFIQNGVLISGLLPIVWVTGLIFFVVRTRLQIGAGATVVLSDPKSFPFEAHHILIFYSGLLIPVSLLVTPAMLRLGKKTLFLIYCLGWLIILSVVFVSPYNFIAWFFD